MLHLVALNYLGLLVLHISKQDGAAYRDVKDRIMLRNGAENE
jgi:hypothetical protein